MKGAYRDLIIWFFGPKNNAKLHNFQPAELVASPAMSPLRHRSVFGAKSAQNCQLRKVRFFVSTSSVVPEPPNSLVFGRNRAPANSIPLACHRSPRFVTARFGPKSAQAAQFASSGVAVFRARQPAENLARSAAARRGEVSACDTSARRTCHRLCYRSV